MKLVLNTALVTAVAALAGTLAVAEAVGVDRHVALEEVAAGRWAARSHAPPPLARRSASRSPERTWTSRWARWAARPPR
jgi:3-hydroxyisobutyrate dehydrogenase-like beta-hydroxyacid dehydrogenase